MDSTAFSTAGNVGRLLAEASNGQSQDYEAGNGHSHTAVSPDNWPSGFFAGVKEAVALAESGQSHKIYSRFARAEAELNEAEGAVPEATAGREQALRYAWLAIEAAANSLPGTASDDDVAENDKQELAGWAESTASWLASDAASDDAANAEGPRPPRQRTRDLLAEAARTPGPPDDFGVPGFVGEAMAHTLATAPYPSRPLAFCGAIALLSVLIGRKVKTASGLRPNVYALALALSAAGKDHPRKINSQILAEAEMLDMLGGKVASGQGLEDALHSNPTQLFQIDEFDSLLTSINERNSPLGAGLVASLLEFYTSANSIFVLRVKAGDEARRRIPFPHLSIFGTCVPRNFFENLTEKSLSNGLLARMLVVEAGARGRGQEARQCPVPESILKTVRYWRDYTPGEGNLANATGVEAMTVPETGEAEAVFRLAREQIDNAYDAAAKCGANGPCSILGRCLEHAQKLAVLYAASENCERPEIGEPAAIWATTYAIRHAMWLIDAAEGRAGVETEFEQIAEKILRRIRTSGGTATWGECLRASKVSSRQFRELAETLIARGDVTLAAGGRGQVLRLAK